MVQQTYKTDIPWMPELPSHWKLERVKNYFNFTCEVVGESYNVFKVLSLSVKGNGVIVRDMESRKGKHSLSMDKYMIVQPNSIVLCLFDMDVTPRIVGYCEDEGIITSAYTNITPKEGIHSKFYYYFFLQQDYNKSLMAQGTGVRTTLTNSQFGAVKIPLPPLEEQIEIANYLVKQSKKIKHFIQKKQAFIELLKEQRQAVISRAVTKGINPDVTLKDSGIEWLGKIPVHWGIRRLKFCLEEKLKYGANESGFDYNPDWYRYIRITDFSKGGILSEEDKLSLPVEIGKEYELKDGDILFARSGATVGKTYQFKKQDVLEKYCYAGYLIKATPDGKIVSSDFLMLYSESLAFENWKNSIFNKATIENIGADKYSVLPITIPPKEEQADIIQFVKTETTIIDQAIAKAEKEIELIKEYREAMIAEAVLGKLHHKIIGNRSEIPNSSEEATPQLTN